jgi:superfamily I DNA/RNA helicase
MDLSDLNELQQSAVEGGGGPVLILAGPGTGKTKTLAARIVYLLKEQNVPASEILALTFTSKAAQEMGDRVRLMGNVSKMPTISTFHALGYEVLRSQPTWRSLKFATNEERLGIVRGLPRPPSLKGLSVRELALKVSRAKGSLHNHYEAADLIGAYNVALVSQGLMDFDDLLSQTYVLLEHDSELRTQHQRYRYVLVDEFQDTSELQWAFVKQLLINDNVLVIGDPNQSIYSFRGASGDMFDRFKSDFPHFKEIALTTNYRSATSVVALTNTIFPSSVPLSAHSQDRGHVQALQTLNEHSEADFILGAIEQGIGGSDLLKAQVESDERQFKDFAILYRTHRAARVIQKRLHDSGIPYQIVGEGSPYDQPEVQAIIGALRWLDKSKDLPNVRNFSAVQARVLLEGINKNQAVSKLVEQIVKAFAFETNDDTTKRQQISQFISTVVRFDNQSNGLEQCVDYFDQLAQSDFYDQTADAVTLLTIHASKGLEFTYVFVVAVEEGTLPNIKKSGESTIEEERRLFYVATSRAKERLDLIYTKKRMGEVREPSRFISEVGDHVLPKAIDPNLPHLEKKLHRRQQKLRQPSLF